MTGRPHEHTGAWAELVESFGGVLLAAEGLGVDKETLRQWTKGRKPRSVLTQRAVNRIAKQRRVTPPFPEV